MRKPQSWLGCKVAAAVALPLLVGSCGFAQRAYFADGYHGGVYGHYPATFTQFMVDMLRQHPDWKLNLEIEPETWDFARTNTPEAYQAFKALVAEQSSEGRVEFVNPAYAQGYLWNLSGESVIQQLDRGMRKVREHFPNAQFVTYSSEEPCFTSALPGVLKSFGFRYAVLKNPNTCWGGYTGAGGGEVFSWHGPDGAAIRTVPRYGIESLKPGSTWETIGAVNSPDYIQAALRSGIAHPAGMCLQDAGWRFGPWQGHASGSQVYEPTEYVTWRHYFEQVIPETPAPERRVSQEDIRVSLIWGAQILQRIAQNVRRAENEIAMAEKLATLASVYRNSAWPEADLDEAWRTLLLSQHHDCWIVPYNGRPGNTWADKVDRWTGATRQACREISLRSEKALLPASETNSPLFVRVFNTLAVERAGLVVADLPETWTAASAQIRDDGGRKVPAQVIGGNGNGPSQVLFLGRAPAMGYSTFRLEEGEASSSAGAAVVQATNGLVRLETDFYRLELDAAKGGTVGSLVAKKLGNRELIDTTNSARFNELRGYFRDQHRFCSSAESPASIEVLESGPVRVRVRIDGRIGSHAMTQWLSLTWGEPRIDCGVRYDWNPDPGIGEDYAQGGGFRAEDNHKAFYDDRFKLLALFPFQGRERKIFKNAPFDVTESRLTNTFFNRWSEIKNNVLVNWVDACDAAGQVGLALLTDHTTSYAQGPDHPLGLTLQYSGVGLWGRAYSLRGPTEVRYALLPHAGDWRRGEVWSAADAWNEPLQARTFGADGGAPLEQVSLLSVEGNGWEIPSARVSDGKILIRLFNASSDAAPRLVRYHGPVARVELVQLNGTPIKELPLQAPKAGATTFRVALPPLGVGTLRITP